MSRLDDRCWALRVVLQPLEKTPGGPQIGGLRDLTRVSSDQDRRLCPGEGLHRVTPAGPTEPVAWVRFMAALKTRAVHFFWRAEAGNYIGATAAGPWFSS